MQSDTAMRNKYGDSNQQAGPMRSQSASYSKAVPIIKMSPGGPIPHNMTKTFDGAVKNKVVDLLAHRWQLTTITA